MPKTRKQKQLVPDIIVMMREDGCIKDILKYSEDKGLVIKVIDYDSEFINNTNRSVLVMSLDTRFFYYKDYCLHFMWRVIYWPGLHNKELMGYCFRAVTDVNLQTMYFLEPGQSLQDAMAKLEPNELYIERDIELSRFNQNI